jgi:hypothetical protein
MFNKRLRHLSKVIWGVIPAERQAVDLVALLSKLTTYVRYSTGMQGNLVKCVSQVADAFCQVPLHASAVPTYV